jgi:hypothetical protein
MSRPLKVSVGPYTFPTLKRATEVARFILHNSPRDIPLAGKDYLFARGLLERHPEAAEKIGSGILSIEVRTIQYGAPGFYVVRTDGTGDDFSYKVALSGAADHRQQVLKAMRQAVRRQTDDFRSAWFDRSADQDGAAVCPLTGRSMTWTESETDHIVPFVRLADRWVSEHGGYGVIRVGSGADHPGAALTDASQNTSWQRWHLQHARLRVIHAGANRARGASGVDA